MYAYNELIWNVVRRWFLDLGFTYCDLHAIWFCVLLYDNFKSEKMKQ